MVKKKNKTASGDTAGRGREITSVRRSGKVSFRRCCLLETDGTERASSVDNWGKSVGTEVESVQRPQVGACRQV